MKIPAPNLLLTVFLILLLAPLPGEGALHPLGGAWEFKGSATVTFGGQSAVYKEDGRITADAGYSRDRWGDGLDEWIYSFRAEGGFEINGAYHGYNHYKRIDERYRGGSFGVSFNDARYVVRITGRRTADVEITRNVSGKTVTATFPAERTRWDDDWDRYYDDGPFYGIGVGCSAGGALPSFFLLLSPLLLLSKPR